MSNKSRSRTLTADHASSESVELSAQDWFKTRQGKKHLKQLLLACQKTTNAPQQHSPDRKDGPKPTTVLDLKKQLRSRKTIRVNANELKSLGWLMNYAGEHWRKGLREAFGQITSALGRELEIPPWDMNRRTLNEFVRTLRECKRDGPADVDDKSQRPRMTVARANDMAVKLTHKMRLGFLALSQRQQAKLIGCSWTTWRKTPFYPKAQAKRPAGKRQKPSSPKTESLTAEREAVTGEGDRDEVLKNLIAEQEADKEPSPLEASQNHPRKIHSRKRL